MNKVKGIIIKKNLIILIISTSIMVGCSRVYNSSVTYDEGEEYNVSELYNNSDKGEDYNVSEQYDVGGKYNKMYYFLLYIKKFRRLIIGIIILTYIIFRKNRIFKN